MKNFWSNWFGPSDYEVVNLGDQIEKDLGELKILKASDEEKHDDPTANLLESIILSIPFDSWKKNEYYDSFYFSNQVGNITLRSKNDFVFLTKDGIDYGICDSKQITDIYNKLFEKNKENMNKLISYSLLEFQTELLKSLDNSTEEVKLKKPRKSKKNLA